MRKRIVVTPLLCFYLSPFLLITIKCVFFYTTIHLTDIDTIYPSTTLVAAKTNAFTLTRYFLFVKTAIKKRHPIRSGIRCLTIISAEIISIQQKRLLLRV